MTTKYHSDLSNTDHFATWLVIDTVYDHESGFRSRCAWVYTNVEQMERDLELLKDPNHTFEVYALDSLQINAFWANATR